MKFWNKPNHLNCVHEEMKSRFNSRGIPAPIRSRIVCLPVYFPNIYRLKYIDIVLPNVSYSVGVKHGFSKRGKNVG